jgi:hypothetical protein
MPPALNTWYRGAHMRSRLEARWAVFFDALGLQWQYETTFVPLPDGHQYVPDFWLPEWGCFAECKPPRGFTGDALFKAAMCVVNMNCAGILYLEGTPAFQSYVYLPRTMPLRYSYRVLSKVRNFPNAGYAELNFDNVPLPKEEAGRYPDTFYAVREASVFNFGVEKGKHISKAVSPWVEKGS